MAQSNASNLYDGMLKKSADQKASASLKARVDNQPVAQYDTDKYIVLAQNHFNVENMYNNEKRNSARIAIVNLNKEYARTYKVSDLEATLALLDLPEKAFETEMVDDRRHPGFSVRRVKRGQLPRPIRMCAEGFLPITSTDDDKIAIAQACVLNILGYKDGHNLSYVRQSNDPKAANYDVYDVEMNEDGDDVVWQTVSYPQYTVSQELSKADKKKAYKILMADPQLKDLVDLIDDPDLA